MKKLIVFFVCMFFMLLQISSYGQLKDKLSQASANGQSVFLVVTENGAADVDKAMNVARQASSAVDHSTVMELNRSDASNSELVAKWGISAAPLPLILVIAQNGVLAGGLLLQQATPANLASLVPSPKKAEVIKTLSEGKSVFLVVSSKTMTEKSDIVNTCQQACIEMEQNAKIIEIDLNDPKEKDFLTSLKIPSNITKPQTYVLNSKGQVTGTFDGAVNAQNLVATAKKVAKTGGCCPGGSSKGK